MNDNWNIGNNYDFYMGRWSKLVALEFVKWLSPRPGAKWLDIGCGTGALSEIISVNHHPSHISAVDQSEEFVSTTQNRLGEKVECKVANAMNLPQSDSSVDICVSGLVLNFIPEPETALREMKRVTCSNGQVACYVWDYAGRMDFLNHFWDIAIMLDPANAHLHEGRRFPDTNVATLTRQFQNAGLITIETTPIEISMRFRNFSDYWDPFLGGQGPAPSYVQNLDSTKRDLLRHSLHAQLSAHGEDSIEFQARAWAIKGVVQK